MLYLRLDRNVWDKKNFVLSIKKLRGLTGSGLKEAKEVIDCLVANGEASMDDVRLPLEDTYNVYVSELKDIGVLIGANEKLETQARKLVEMECMLIMKGMAAEAAPLRDVLNAWGYGNHDFSVEQES